MNIYGLDIRNKSKYPEVTLQRMIFMSTFNRAYSRFNPKVKSMILAKAKYRMIGVITQGSYFTFDREEISLITEFSEYIFDNHANLERTNKVLLIGSNIAHHKRNSRRVYAKIGSFNHCYNAPDRKVFKKIKIKLGFPMTNTGMWRFYN